MSKWNRRLAAFALTAALLAGIGCTSSDSPVAPSAEPPAQLLSALSSVVDLLTCKAQPYAVTTGVIGSEGGTLAVGAHQLVIPRGALRRNVTIKAEQMSGSVNSVRFSPEGLKFATPATLTMSYRNCVLVLIPKKIAYTTDLLKVIRLLPSRDATQSKTVTSPLDHFSRYAVAY